MIERINIIEKQKEICVKYKLDYVPTLDSMMVGVSDDFLEKKTFPLNGLRHSPEGQGSGWFFWSGGGEIPPERDYFKPLHSIHLIEEFPEVTKYLGLPPGSRIQFDLEGYEDVWFDQKLLEE